eukprot:3213543-Prorocentrum_lima.AAC.1
MKSFFHMLGLEYPVIPSMRAVKHHKNANGEHQVCPFIRQNWTVPTAGLLALLGHWCSHRRK